jgi:hypothetical protein
MADCSPKGRGEVGEKGISCDAYGGSAGDKGLTRTSAGEEKAPPALLVEKVVTPFDLAQDNGGSSGFDEDAPDAVVADTFEQSSSTTMQPEF